MKYKEMIYQEGRVGPIASGMSRAEVRGLLGSFEEFRKSMMSDNTTDDFVGQGVHMYYTSDDVVEEMEVFPEVKIIIFGLDIFALNLRELRYELSLQGLAIEEADCGVSIMQNRTRFYAPDISDSPEAKIESVFFCL